MLIPVGPTYQPGGFRYLPLYTLSTLGKAQEGVSQSTLYTIRAARGEYHSPLWGSEVSRSLDLLSRGDRAVMDLPSVVAGTVE